MNISFENHGSISKFFYVLGSVDIMLSHDWPNGITDYGNVEQLLRFKRFFADDIQNNRLGFETSYGHFEVPEAKVLVFWTFPL